MENMSHREAALFALVISNRIKMETKRISLDEKGGEEEATQ